MTEIKTQGGGQGYARTDCSVCVHGHDLDPREGSMVVCTPQHKAHDPRHCCTGFRRITLAEIDERTAAKFGTPNAAGEVRRNAVTSTGLLAVSESGDK